MNKRILILVIIAAVIVGGLYYFTMDRPEEQSESNLSEESIAEESYGQVDKNQEEEVQEEKTSEDIMPDIAVGKEAPDFTLLNLEGEEVSLSDYRGQYVLINFWYTGCSYCDIEMPDLQRLHDDNDDLVVLSVNVMEDKPIVENYIEENELTFPVVLDIEGEVATTYLIGGFPTSYFIDKEGILIGGVPGMLTHEQMVQIMDDIRENK